MLNLLAFPVAVVLGFLAGLGVGGGSILMLWLTAVVGMEHGDARTINLLFFLPCALISTIFHQKLGTVKIRKLLPGIIYGCIAAAIGSLIAKQADTELLKKLFGWLFILTGTRELFYRPRNAK